MLQKSADTRKKLPPLKSILALPTWGQKCFVSVADAFEIPDFDLGHPVQHINNSKLAITLDQTSKKSIGYFS